MDDFSTPGVVNSYGYAPSEANFIAPGKRPLSSMSPTIIVDNENRVRLIIGASGGSKIITAIAQACIRIVLDMIRNENVKNRFLNLIEIFKVVIKSLFMGVDLKTAIDDRRIHHQLIPTYAEIEEDFPLVTQNLEK